MAPMRVADRTTTTASTLAFAQKTPALNGGLRQKPHWDPYRTLDLYPNDPDFQCIGIAKYSDARCRWRFFDRSIGRGACAQLDLIASRRPSDVTREMLEVLASTLLCDNHGMQKYGKVAEWNRMIAEVAAAVVGEGVEAEEQQQQQMSSSVEAEEEIRRLQREMDQLKVERDEYQVQYGNSLEMNVRLAESDLATTEEIQRLKKDVQDRQRDFDELEKSRSKELTEREALHRQVEVLDREKEEAIQSLEMAVQAKQKGVDKLKKLRSYGLAQTQALCKLESSDQEKSETIHRLATAVQGKQKDVEELKKHRSEDLVKLEALESSNREKSDKIQKLETEMQELKQDVEELKKKNLQSAADLKDLDALRQQTKTSNSLIESLSAKRESDRQKMEKLENRNRENERKNRKLEQQNRGLKQQKYLAAFRNAVQLVVARKRYESAEAKGSELREQNANLLQRMEDAETRSAAVAKDVSDKKNFFFLFAL